MVLQLNNIAYQRPEIALFSGLSLTIEKQVCLLIQGKNGSGKSTLLRLIAGLLPLQAGTILFNQQDISTIKASYQQALHFLGHLNGLKLDLSVEENLKLYAALQQVDIEASLSKVLQAFQLSEKANTAIKYLSAGQKRRVALCKLALLAKPIWILDEPLTALDKHSQQFFINLLQAHLAHDGIAIISAHHDLPTMDLKIKTLQLTHHD